MDCKKKFMAKIEFHEGTSLISGSFFIVQEILNLHFKKFSIEMSGERSIGRHFATAKCHKGAASESFNITGGALLCFR